MEQCECNHCQACFAAWKLRFASDASRHPQVTSFDGLPRDATEVSLSAYRLGDTFVHATSNTALGSFAHVNRLSDSSPEQDVQSGLLIPENHMHKLLSKTCSVQETVAGPYRHLDACIAALPGWLCVMKAEQYGAIQQSGAEVECTVTITSAGQVHVRTTQAAIHAAGVGAAAAQPDDARLLASFPVLSSATEGTVVEAVVLSPPHQHAAGTADQAEDAADELVAPSAGATMLVCAVSVPGSTSFRVIAIPMTLMLVSDRFGKPSFELALGDTRTLVQAVEPLVLAGRANAYSRILFALASGSVYIATAQGLHWWTGAGTSLAGPPYSLQPWNAVLEGRRKASTGAANPPQLHGAASIVAALCALEDGLLVTSTDGTALYLGRHGAARYAIRLAGMDTVLAAAAVQPATRGHNDADNVPRLLLQQQVVGPVVVSLVSVAQSLQTGDALGHNKNDADGSAPLTASALILHDAVTGYLLHTLELAPHAAWRAGTDKVGAAQPVPVPVAGVKLGGYALVQQVHYTPSAPVTGDAKSAGTGAAVSVRHVPRDRSMILCSRPGVHGLVHVRLPDVTRYVQLLAGTAWQHYKADGADDASSIDESADNGATVEAGVRSALAKAALVQLCTAGATGKASAGKEGQAADALAHVSAVSDIALPRIEDIPPSALAAALQFAWGSAGQVPGALSILSELQGLSEPSSAFSSANGGSNANNATQLSGFNLLGCVRSATEAWRTLISVAPGLALLLPSNGTDVLSSGAATADGIAQASLAASLPFSHPVPITSSDVLTSADDPVAFRLLRLLRILKVNRQQVQAALGLKLIVDGDGTEKVQLVPSTDSPVHPHMAGHGSVSNGKSGNRIAGVKAVNNSTAVDDAAVASSGLSGSLASIYDDPSSYGQALKSGNLSPTASGGQGADGHVRASSKAHGRAHGQDHGHAQHGDTASSSSSHTDGHGSSASGSGAGSSSASASSAPGSPGAHPPRLQRRASLTGHAKDGLDAALEKAMTKATVAEKAASQTGSAQGGAAGHSSSSLDAALEKAMAKANANAAAAAATAGQPPAPTPLLGESSGGSGPVARTYYNSSSSSAAAAAGAGGAGAAKKGTDKRAMAADRASDRDEWGPLPALPLAEDFSSVEAAWHHSSSAVVSAILNFLRVRFTAHTIVRVLEARASLVARAVTDGSRVKAAEATTAATDNARTAAIRLLSAPATRGRSPQAMSNWTSPDLSLDQCLSSMMVRATDVLHRANVQHVRFTRLSHIGDETAEPTAFELLQELQAHKALVALLARVTAATHGGKDKKRIVEGEEKKGEEVHVVSSPASESPYDASGRVDLDWLRAQLASPALLKTLVAHDTLHSSNVAAPVGSEDGGQAGLHVEEPALLETLVRYVHCIDPTGDLILDLTARLQALAVKQGEGEASGVGQNEALASARERGLRVLDRVLSSLPLLPGIESIDGQTQHAFTTGGLHLPQSPQTGAALSTGRPWRAEREVMVLCSVARQAAGVAAGAWAGDQTHGTRTGAQEGHHSSPRGSVSTGAGHAHAPRHGVTSPSSSGVFGSGGGMIRDPRGERAHSNTDGHKRGFGRVERVTSDELDDVARLVADDLSSELGRPVGNGGASGTGHRNSQNNGRARVSFAGSDGAGRGRTRSAAGSFGQGPAGSPGPVSHANIRGSFADVNCDAHGIVPADGITTPPRRLSYVGQPGSRARAGSVAGRTASNATLHSHQHYIQHAEPVHVRMDAPLRTHAALLLSTGRRAQAARVLAQHGVWPLSFILLWKAELGEDVEAYRGDCGALDLLVSMLNEQASAEAAASASSTELGHGHSGSGSSSSLSSVHAHHERPRLAWLLPTAPAGLQAVVARVIMRYWQAWCSRKGHGAVHGHRAGASCTEVSTESTMTIVPSQPAPDASVVSLASYGLLEWRALLALAQGGQAPDTRVPLITAGGSVDDAWETGRVGLWAALFETALRTGEVANVLLLWLRCPAGMTATGVLAILRAVLHRQATLEAGSKQAQQLQERLETGANNRKDIFHSSSSSACDMRALERVPVWAVLEPLCWLAQQQAEAVTAGGSK